MKKLWIVLIVALLVASVAVGCGEKSEVTVTGITLSGLKTTYTQGEEVDLEGAIVSVAYSDGSSETVSLDRNWISKGINTQTVGKKTMTGTYKDYPFTFTYTVTQAEVISRITEVKVEGLNDTYKINDPLNIADCYLVVSVRDEEDLRIPLTHRMIAGFDTSRSGNRQLTVSYDTVYGTAQCTFDYTVIARNVVEVTSTLPELSFYQDDEVDQLMAILADHPFVFSYSDDTTAWVTVTDPKAVSGWATAMITDRATCSVKVTDRAGRNQTVTLTYRVKERYDEQVVTFVSQDFSFTRTTVDGYVEEPVLTQAGYDLLGWYTADGTKFSFKTRLDAPLTLTARWEALRYTVTLYNFGEEETTVEYTVETSKSLPSPRPRNGYSFDTYLDAKGNPYNLIPKGSTGSFSLYGQWSAVTYNVTFALEDDNSSIKATQSNPSTYTIDTTLSLSPATRPGFDFVGWRDEESGRMVESLAGLWGERTLHAGWKATLYTLYFHHDVTDEVIDTLTFRVTDSDTRLPQATIAGYRFLGWYANRECSQEVQKDRDGNYILLAGSSGDKHYYAKTVKTYTVRLNLADGEAAQYVEFALSDGQVSLPIAERFGCDFEYWYDADGKKFEPTSGEIKVAAEEIAVYDGKVLYAEWKEHVHTITYRMLYVDPESMSEEEVTAQGSFGAVTDTPLLIPERGGYLFGAWYITEQLIGTPYTTLPKDTFDRDLILYAGWNIQTYTLTAHYNLPDELVTEVELPKTFRIIDNYALPAPQALYHTFRGWYRDEGCTKRIGEIKDCYGDLDIYADWTEVLYSPVVLNQGGEEFQGDYNLPTYGYSTTGNVNLGTATRTGYTFGGWFDNPECTGTKVSSFNARAYLDAPPTYYAKWSLNTYNLTYNFVSDTGAALSGVTNTNPKTYTVEAHVTFADATRNGYAFVGWYLDKDGNEPILSTQGFGDKLTVYGVLRPGTYSIAYDRESVLTYLDEETIAGMPSSYVLGDANTNTTTFKSNILNKITRTGYYLKGLYIQSAPSSMLTALGATTMSATAPACQDVTLYAAWYPVTYTVNYRYRNLSTGSTSTLTANDYKTASIEDIAAGFALPDPTQINNSLRGRDYRGWYTSDSGYDEDGFDTLTTAILSGLTYTVSFNNSTAKATASVTLYTRLLLIEYPVEYVLPEGATNPNTKTSYTYATSGTANNLSGATMSGYTFVGWYLDEDYTEQVQNLNNRTGAVTLYAYFERNVAVSFELNGSSSSVSAVTYTANKASTISSKPTLSKHTFAGWWYVEGETYVGTTLPQGLRSETITLRAMFYNSTTAGLTFDVTTEAATIVGHTFTTKTAVTLPTYVGGTVYQVPVVAIAGSAFYQANISTLTWAPAGETSSIASVGTYAFYQSTMTALSLPATLTSIGRGAFGGLSGVTSLTVDAVAGTGTVECPNATTVVLNVDLTSGVLKGFGSVATLTHSGKYSLSYYFGGASSIPSSLTAVHVTGNTVCSAMLTGSQVATVYLVGEMVDLDSFEVLYQYARNATLSIKVPSSLLSAYQTNYQAYVDELDTLTLS